MHRPLRTLAPLTFALIASTALVGCAKEGPSTAEKAAEPAAAAAPSGEAAKADGAEADKPAEAAAADPAAIDTAKAKQWIADGALVIDVRSDEEVAGGMYEGAKHIPHVQMDERLAEVEGWLGGDKSKPVVLYCRSGGRAGLAAETLAEAGFTQIVNAGGLDALQAN